MGESCKPSQKHFSLAQGHGLGLATRVSWRLGPTFSTCSCGALHKAPTKAPADAAKPILDVSHCSPRLSQELLLGLCSLKTPGKHHSAQKTVTHCSYARGHAAHTTACGRGPHGLTRSWKCPPALSLFPLSLI